MPERYISIREASKIIGVTPLTLRNWDKKRLLVAYRNPLNNYRLYRYADVADLIAAIREGPKISRPVERHKLVIKVEDYDAAETSPEVITA